MTTHGPFDAWAPRPERVPLHLDGQVLDMDRGADGWWAPAEPLPAAAGGAHAEYGYLLADDPPPPPPPPPPTAGGRRPSRCRPGPAALTPTTATSSTTTPSRAPTHGHAASPTACTG